MKRANGLLWRDGRQVRAVIQAKTKKRMVELVQQVNGNFRMSDLNTYFSMCWGRPATESIGNDCEEEGVWWTTESDYRDGNYVKVV